MSVKIIDGCLFHRKNADWFNVKAWTAPTGHMEVTAVRGTYWEEQATTDFALSMAREAMQRHLDETVEERAEASAKASARRAQKRVRQCAKAMGVNTLCTLTYHANVTDLAQVKKDLKEFNRRVLRVWPQFRFVAAFETQKRGAWHVHLGCPAIPRELPGHKGVKFKSWAVLRAIWRSVTKENGGNFDAQRRKKSARKGAAQVAAYISKYMLKDFAEGEKWSNRWTRFGPVELPKPVDLGIVANLSEALEVCYSLTGSTEVRTARLDKWGNWFYLDVEPAT